MATIALFDGRDGLDPATIAKLNNDFKILQAEVRSLSEEVKQLKQK